MASPEKTAQGKQTTPILDLTGDKPIERSIPKWKEISGHSYQNTKHQRRNGQTQDLTRKTVQWKDAEVRNYNPNAPAIPPPLAATWHTHNMLATNPRSILPFHPTQMPLSTLAQHTLATPFYFPTQVDNFNSLLQQHMQTPNHYTKPPEKPLNPFQKFPQPHVTSRENPFGTQNTSNPPNKK
jgi:hypothetical protein